jgi:dipeptidyl aminopeptidase/acylaminoacyl peptidase
MSPPQPARAASHRTRHWVAYLTGAALVLVVLLAGPGPAGASFPGTNGLIAYTLAPDLWVVDPATSGARAVTAGLGVRANDPAWAPDGSRLAFGNIVTETGGIWVVRSDGTGGTRLTTLATDAQPAWSPDGAKIAFVRRQGQFDRLFVMAADGSGVTAVTGSIDVHVQDPEWSPDGTKFVFSNGTDIYVVGVDGSGLLKLTGAGTPGTLRGGRFPSWSPDGKTIAFSAVDSIRLIGADGTGNRALVSALREVWELSWSPDGTKIAFVNDAAGPFQEELFVVNADGSNVTRPAVDTETTLDWGVVPPPPPPPPPPVLGKTVNVGPVSGVVRVRPRGTQRFVVLAASTQIPVGSELDTTRGRVGVTAAIGGGQTERGEFYEGRFVVVQAVAAKPVATVRLTAPFTCPRTTRTTAGEAAPPRRRRLWGDAKGTFRTQGKYATAVVRGTVWLTEDRCDGTLIRVRTGSVTVRDLVRKRTVVVRAGKSYLARKP